jgi:hypothetical protein
MAELRLHENNNFDQVIKNFFCDKIMKLFEQ